MVGFPHLCQFTGGYMGQGRDLRSRGTQILFMFSIDHSYLILTYFDAYPYQTIQASCLGVDQFQQY